MTLGADINYRVKKLERRIRAAEEETQVWAQKYEAEVAFRLQEAEEFRTTINLLNENIAKLKTRLAYKPKEERTAAPIPRGPRKVKK